MPWHKTLMKDVAVCDKLRGADEQALIRRCLNGETRLGSCLVTRTWIHRVCRGKHGNWNILVPWGNESNNDSGSSGERIRISPNLTSFRVSTRISWQANVSTGVARTKRPCRRTWFIESSYMRQKDCHPFAKVRNYMASRSSWKAAPERVIAPYAKAL